MKKVIIGMGIILSSVLWFCTLVICGFVNCIGEGKQHWSFAEQGFSDVIAELSLFSIIIPIAVLAIGVWLVVLGFKEEK